MQAHVIQKFIEICEQYGYDTCPFLLVCAVAEDADQHAQHMALYVTLELQLHAYSSSCLEQNAEGISVHQRCTTDPLPSKIEDKAGSLPCEGQRITYC